jgi:hypothetical protein
MMKGHTAVMLPMSTDIVWQAPAVVQKEMRFEQNTSVESSDINALIVPDM